VVNSFEDLAKKGGMKGVVIEDNVHDDKIIGKLIVSKYNVYAMHSCGNIKKKI